MTDYVAIPGPLGAMLVAADDRTLLGIWFEGQKYHPDPAGWTHRPDHPLLARAAGQLHGYFEDRGRTGFDLPLAQRGTAFQQAVWAQLQRIPAGETWTYGTLAARLCRRSGAQGLASGLGKRPATGRLLAGGAGVGRHRPVALMAAGAPA
mgnify:CR=1 FL=1